MFSLEELLDQLPKLIQKPQPTLETIDFTQHEFRSSSSEESITICRGVKSDFESAVHFWVVTQLYWDWSDREEYLLPYFQEAVCQPLEEKEFMLILSQTHGLKRPFVLTPKGDFLWAQKMANDWNDSSAMAEFEDEYLSFHWTTTA